MFQRNRPEGNPTDRRESAGEESLTSRLASQIPWTSLAWHSAGVLLVFVCFSAQLPPDVNESHYLTKARHAWNPAWCPDDLFLSSSFSHWLFYQLTGWWNALLTLPQIAWTGRIVTWTALAVAWARLSLNVSAAAWFPMATAAIWVLLTDQLHLAGEWAVGGFESKGLAYALVLWALGSLLRRQWATVWLALGAATAFHVLVGGWAWVAIGFVWGLGLAGQSSRTLRLQYARSTLTPPTAGPWGPVSLAAGLLLCLPGILPPLLADLSATNEQISAASSIYVDFRIAHHLKFSAFSTAMVARFLTLTLVTFSLPWLARRLNLSLPAAGGTLLAFATGSLLISFVGLWLTAVANQQGPGSSAATWWLRFYWFRLADVAMPLTASLLGVALLQGGLDRSRATVARLVAATVLGLLLVGFAGRVYQRHSDPRPRADRRSLPSYPDQPERTLATYRNWLKVCQWIREQTPPEAVFLTPADQQTFKWYAQRSEVVSWKDVPQDALAMLEWRDRIDVLYRPQQRYLTGLMSYSDDQLLALADRYGADYLLVPQAEVEQLSEPTRLPRLYPTDPSEKSTYVVFQLRR